MRLGWVSSQKVAAVAPTIAPTNVRSVDSVGDDCPFGWGGTIRLAWTAPAGTITDYVVQYSPESSSGYATTWTTYSDGTSTATTATITGLTNGVRYLFRVAAANGGGTGPYGESFWGCTPVADSAPITPPTGPSPQTSAPWELDRLDERVRSGAGSFDLTWTGKRVRVYVVDGGLRGTHVEFSNNAPVDAYSPDGSSAFTVAGSPYTDHGTECASKAVGGTVGVARDAQLYAVKAYDSTTFFDPSSCYAWIAANHPAGMPAVVTNSSLWIAAAGATGDKAAGAAAHALLAAAGIPVVECVGNNFGAVADMPDPTPGCIYVAGIATGDVVSSTTRLSPLADVFAGDTDITCATASSDSSYSSTPDGTSFAAPQVAGIVATWLEANWRLTPFQIQDMVRAYSTKDVITGSLGGNPNRLAYLYAGIPSTMPWFPTALNATAGSGQVVLTWTAPVTDGGSSITDYIVQYRTTSGPGSWTTFTDGVSSSTGATVTGLTNSTGYDFRVAAINARGTGSYSTTASATPVSSSTAPSQVGTVTPTRGNGQVALAWSAPSNGGSAITDYVIQYRTTVGPGSWTTFTDGTSSSTGATVTGLTNGTSYDFQVAAVNAIGTGSYSTAVTAVPATVPSAVGTVTPTAGSGQVALAWSAPANGGAALTDYTVQYRTTVGPGSWTTFTDGVSSTTGATVTGLTNGTSYDFQVLATNVVGNGSYSTAVTSSPAAVPANTVTYTYGATNSYTAPSGVTSSDYIVVMSFIATLSASDSPSISGLTKRAQLTYNTGAGYWIHWCLFDSGGANMSAVGSYTIAPGGTAVAYAGVCKRVANTSGYDSVAAAARKEDLGVAAGTPVSLPAITTAVNNDLLMAHRAYSASTGTVPLPPTGWTALTVPGSGSSFEKVQAVAGSSGSDATSYAITSDMYTFICAYKPL